MAKAKGAKGAKAKRVTLEDIVRTGPGTLGGRYLRSFWQPVYVGAHLKPGRALPIRVMSEDFTLYRGEGGVPHVVAFRCAHRGTQLSTGWVRGDHLSCFYHGWTYDGAGQCVEQPAEAPGKAKSARIRAYPTEEYLGLIFAYLGEGKAPPLPRYPELEEEGVLEVAGGVVWPCNFFNRVENSADPVHLAFAHADSGFTEGGLVAVPEPSGEETAFGLTISAKRPGAPARKTHFHMPNVNYIKGSPNEPGLGWVEHLSWRVPVDDENCGSYTMSLTHVTGAAAEEYRERRRRRLAEAREGGSAATLGPLILGGKMRIEDVADRTFLVNVQDYVAQVGQGAIADRAHERLGRSDRVLVQLRRLYLRELQALADGRPLKRWHRDACVVATVGV